MDKKKPLEIVYSQCKACGICYKICPTGAIQGDDLGKVVLAEPDKCIKCGICELHCPDYVITVVR